MARFAYAVTLALVGILLAMLDAPDLVPPTADAVAPLPPEAPIVSTTPIITSGDGGSTAPAPAPAVAPTGRDIADARIVVARLGIDLPIEWGEVGRDVPRTDYPGATPEHVALVFPGSALPGAGGNTFIYSHARTGMFISIWNIRPGDLVALRWPGFELTYEVQRIVAKVPPTDTSWLDPEGPERLTLQTSTGPNPSDPRFIAVAVPVAGR